MEYKPLVQFNPANTDLTQGSSQWLASRLMPGKGTATDNSLICVPDFKITNGTAMRTCANGDVKTSTILGIDPSTNTVANCESSARLFAWRGCWVSGNSSLVSENSPLIGRGHAAVGLICPFNTFNAGYQYKKNGWRPSRVN